MATDTERREVARRLRSANEHSCAPDCELRNALDGNCDCKWNGCTRCHRDAFDRLADLIEPSEPKVRCIAEVKVDGERLKGLVDDAVVELTGIDRDALLKEVQELENGAWYFSLDFDEDEPLRDRLKEASEDFARSARRIREALGVES